MDSDCLIRRLLAAYWIYKRIFKLGIPAASYLGWSQLNEYTHGSLNPGFRLPHTQIARNLQDIQRDLYTKGFRLPHTQVGRDLMNIQKDLRTRASVCLILRLLAAQCIYTRFFKLGIPTASYLAWPQLNDYTTGPLNQGFRRPHTQSGRNLLNLQKDLQTRESDCLILRLVTTY